MSINDRNVAAGETVSGQVVHGAVFWQSRTIDPAASFDYVLSIAYGNNNAGVIVGYAKTGAGIPVAVQFNGRTITELRLPGREVWVSSSALDVNDSGIAVGSMVTSDIRQSPARWNNGSPVTLPSALPAYATAINESGNATGLTNNSNVAYWNGIALTDLGKFPMSFSSVGLDINDSNEIVGQFTGDFWTYRS